MIKYETLTRMNLEKIYLISDREGWQFLQLETPAGLILCTPMDKK